MGIKSVATIISVRDDVPFESALELVNECKDFILEGNDPDEAIRDFLGLEPDYLLDII